MRRAVLAIVPLVALVAIGAGCGGSDSESETDPVATWASDFCTSVSDWKTELESITSGFSDPSNLSEENIRSAADEAKSATDTLRDELRGLGAPDTDSGQEVQDAVDSFSSTVEDETEKIQEAAEGVSNLTELPAAISTISTSVSTIITAGTEAKQTVEDADAGGELRTAFEDSPECDDLTS